MGNKIKRVILIVLVYAILLSGCGVETYEDVTGMVEQYLAELTNTTETEEEGLQMNGNLENSTEAEGRRVVILGVEYSPKLLGKTNKNTEITLYVDGIEIGKMNCGDIYNFEMQLEMGEHTLKVKRNVLDKESYKFNVEKIEDPIFSEQYVALKYTFHSLSSNGKLEESDFVHAVDENYICIDFDAS